MDAPREDEAAPGPRSELEADAPRERPGAPSSRSPSGWPTLALPVAGVGVLAWLLSRGLAPGLRGAAVGIGRLIDAADFAARFVSYGFALVGSAYLLATTTSVVRAPIATVVRYGNLPLVGVVIWASTAAAFTRLPTGALFLPGVAASVSVLGLALALRRRSSLDRAGALLLLVALGASVSAAARLAAAWVGERAASELDPDRFALARSLSSWAVGSLLAVAVGAFLAVEGSRVTGAQEPRPLARPATLAALVALVLVVRGAVAADGDDPSTAAVLCRRVLDALGSRPLPTRGMLRLVAHAAAVVVCSFALLESRVRPSARAATAFLVAGAGAPDRPLGALLLALGAGQTALSVLDRAEVWSHLERAPRQG